MRERKARGLLAFWTDVDDEYLLEVQKWHNCEHLTERVSIPGFLVGLRYRGLGSAPTFAIFYETTDTQVLKSQPYHRTLNNPTPWTREALTHFKNNIRNIYTLLSSGGKSAPTEAPYTYVIRFNLDPVSECEAVEWIKGVYLPEISHLSGVYRVRFYQIDEEISNIMTGEREIYGGGPGQQKYMLLFELAAPDVPQGKEWQGIDRSAGNMVGKWKDPFKEYSFLEFVMYAPGGP
jgi:hypothetical protein